MDKFVKMYLRQDRETLQWIYSIQSNSFLDVIGEFNGEERALVLGQRLERDADDKPIYTEGEDQSDFKYHYALLPDKYSEFTTAEVLIDYPANIALNVYTGEVDFGAYA